MSKDTIYIDVEDDITAIIGKVKAASSKIVALVPPKRIGVLQSAVNLRLLARAAKQSEKHLVLISSNSALTALAASAGIPSARTLQSKPELAPLPEDTSPPGEDIIDGADLPVGDLARAEGSEAEVAKAAPAIDSAIRANAAEEAAVAPLPRPPKAKRSSIAVPNFNTFRKRLTLGIGGLVVLVGFLVWAIWFAPHATIAITARTIESSANPKVVLATSASTDVAAGTIKAMKEEIKQEASASFEATGEKEVGEKAKGNIIFHNCESSNSITIPAGTGVSAGGKTYITQSASTVPGGSGGFGGCAVPGKSAPVAVVAQDIGEDYNADANTQFSVAGYSNSSSVKYFRAVASTDIEGGSKRKVKVVTKEDVDKAADQLASQSMSAMKAQLTEQFGEDVVVIDSSFNSDKTAIASLPAIDGEAADGQAKLTGSITFSLFGVSKTEIGRFLDDYFAQQIEEGENQRVYENGVDKTTFIDIVAGDNGYSATMTATAKFGPKIDDEKVKSEAKGKKYGDVQSAIEAIPGVEDVDVKFRPFWVKTVPKDETRITIEFNLNESK